MDPVESTDVDVTLGLDGRTLQDSTGAGSETGCAAATTRARVGRGAGQQGRLTDYVDDPRWGWQQRLDQAHDAVLDLLALPAEQFAGSLLLEAFEGGHVGAEDELVDGLNEVLVKLLALRLLLGPVVRVRLRVDAVDILVVLDQGLDGVRRELVGNLVLSTMSTWTIYASRWITWKFAMASTSGLSGHS